MRAPRRALLPLSSLSALLFPKRTREARKPLPPSPSVSLFPAAYPSYAVTDLCCQVDTPISTGNHSSSIRWPWAQPASAERHLKVRKLRPGSADRVRTIGALAADGHQRQCCRDRCTRQVGGSRFARCGLCGVRFRGSREGRQRSRAEKRLVHYRVGPNGRELISRLAAIVVLTGVDDYVSDGETVIKASNGHELVSSPGKGLQPRS